MIYSKFIEKTTKYLHSVRVLKNYLSFDMSFPSSWLLLKKYPEGIEIIQNQTNDGTTITSFVTINNKELLDVLENTVETIIKSNIEREEKEKLFKNKVQELKNIFEKEKLENLKSLKFDIEELTKLMNHEESEGIEQVDGGTESTKK